MIKIISYLKDRILQISIISLASLIPLTWFDSGKLIFGHDMMPIVGIDNFFRSLFIINDSLYGGIVVSYTMARVVIDFYFKIIQMLGFSLISTEKIFFVLLVFMGITGSYLLFKEIIKVKNLVNDKISTLFLLLCSLYYIFNPFTLERWHELQTGQVILFYGIPLLFFLYIKICEKLTLTRVILFIIASLSIFVTGLMNPGDMVSVFSTFSIILAFVFRTKINLKGTIVVCVILFSCALPFVTSTYFFEKYSSQTEFSSQTTSSFENIVNKDATIINTFQFTNSYPRNLVIKNDGESNLYTWNAYYNNIVVIVINFVFIILFLSILFFRNIKNNIKCDWYILFGAFLVGIFLIKGANGPFGQFNLFLYEKMPFFWIFRSPDLRFTPFVILAITLILIFYFSSIYDKRTRIVISGIFMLYFLVIVSYPIITRTVIEGQRGIIPSLNTQISNEYLQVAEILNSEKSSSKVLYLPTRYWYLSGKDIKYTGWPFLNHIINKMVFYNSSGALIPKNTNKLIGSFFSGDFSPDNLKKMGIGYIVYDHNADINRELVNPQEFDSLYDSLELAITKYGYKRDTISSLELITLQESTPLISVDNDIKNNEIVFKKINPVKYNIDLLLKTGSTSLNFLENYDKSWNIYLRPVGDKLECNSPVHFNEFNVTECAQEKKYIDLESISIRSFPKIDNANHHILNSFANSWTINQNYITSNFPNTYYEIMPDGRLRLNIILLYRSQLFVYASLAISFILITASVCFLTILRIRHKD